MVEDRGGVDLVRTAFREVAERRVLPWLLAYLAGGWILLEATNFMVNELGWPAVLTSALLVILGFGILSAVTVAWFHGASGWQRVTRRELEIHAVIVVGTVAVLTVGPLPELASESAAEPGSSGVSELPASDRRSPPPLERIAVLYLKDHTGGDFSMAAQSLTEGIVHELAQTERLDVLPLTSVQPYRGSSAGTSQVVDELRVGALVEGSVTRVGDSACVTVQVVDGASGTHLDSREWLVPAADLREGDRRLATDVANRVRRALGRAVRARDLAAGAPDSRTLELYRRAEGIFLDEAATDVMDDRTGTLVLLAEADSLLAEAERIAPRWTRPAILRSEVAAYRSLLRGRAGERSRADLEAAIEHADRAVRLGDDRGNALEQRGKARVTLAEYAPAEVADSLRSAAERDLREAVRLGPGRAEALMALSELSNRQGKFNAAYRYAHQATEADAFLEFGSEVYDRLFTGALQLERIADAEALCARARRRYPGDQTHYQNHLLVLASRPSPSSRAIERAWAAADTLSALALVERRAEWLALGHMMVAPTLAGAGLADSADAAMTRARERLVELDARGFQHAASYFEAYAHLRLGRPDTALALLPDYVEGYPARARSLTSDWWFRDLWDDPRFQAITRTAPVADRS